MPKRTILLVEDRESEVILAERALSGTGHGERLVVARDGAEALAFLHDDGGAERVGLVVVDLKMPLLDGRDVLERIRADPRTRYVPVVVLTSSTRPDDVASCYDLRANSFLVKPLDYHAFRDALRLACSYWLELNTVPDS